ncbi:hypothetical protein P7D22_00950 [Lichenihabitans sp. Uapishka_5]|uniref:hypothetical protein n=1 Tax=Lichenihabitans sp. Uapishka_5 TaxID=3037302 RepID=UPI0029E7E100|nr:hypothetical protein [Lichenihabitans sp. Uapishka_5]MDX7949744.1 hypothetical protein [Lichenihabitans sp. Uapishka_5]
MQDLVRVEPSRRNICAALLALSFARVRPLYADLGWTVHRILPAQLLSVRIGDLIYDRGCSRLFRVVRTMETEVGLVAKMEWVQRVV